MDRVVEVGIVGAGPYGLSVAAHLRKAGVSYRIFGKPMQFWQDNVPHGTCLKSDGSSSDLIDPEGALRIARYYSEQGQPFQITTPIPVETFVSYGEAFKARFVPNTETCDITSVARRGDAFALTTSEGETVLVRRVVLAIGIGPFAALPKVFADLPASAVTHSSAYGSVAGLTGRSVAVIGSGASAIDVAAVAHEAGAEVTILSGRETIEFHPPPAHRKFRQKVRRPDTGIGAGWSHWFYVHLADVFRMLPSAKRISIVTTALGPSPGWFMKDRIVGQVPVMNGVVPTRATLDGGKVRIELSKSAGTAHLSGAPKEKLTDLVVDHVVAATGFRIDMQRLGILDASVLSGLRTEEGAPVLSRNFETSVPGLYVVGPAAAYSFGPVMRFVFGAGFAVPRVAGHLVSQAASAPAPAPAAKVREMAAVP